MAKIKIEPSKAKAVLGRQNSLENTLKELCQDVDSIRSGLRYKIAGQENISQRLREVAEQITKEQQSTGALRSGLEEIIILYEQSEGKNRDLVAAEKTSIQQGGTAAMSQPQMPEEDGSHDAAWWDKLIDFIFPKTDSDKKGGTLDNPFLQYLPVLLGLPPFYYYTTEDKTIGSNVNWDMGDALKDKPGFKQFDEFKNNHQTTLKDSKMFIDPKTKMITLVDPNNPQQMEEFKKHNESSIPVDVKLLGTGTGGSMSWYDDQGFLDSDKVFGIGGLKSDGSIQLGTLEGDASVYIGSMGLGAAIGVGYTAFSAEEKLSFGTDDAQIYGKLGVDVGRVGASASGGIGFIDADHKINPNAHVDLSAEAIVGEVTGSVGGKVLGTDVAVTGSLNYGLGAHANIGFQDGKFSVDLGATVGVGGSVKLDIDVSGTVNAIGQGVGDIVSGTGELIGNAVEGAGEFFGGIGEGLGNIFN